jgi:hypothetical protein
MDGHVVADTALRMSFRCISPEMRWTTRAAVNTTAAPMIGPSTRGSMIRTSNRTSGPDGLSSLMLSLMEQFPKMRSDESYGNAQARRDRACATL